MGGIEVYASVVGHELGRVQVDNNFQIKGPTAKASKNTQVKSIEGSSIN
jgi:hypothetical protein